MTNHSSMLVYFRNKKKFQKIISVSNPDDCESYVFIPDTRPPLVLSDDSLSVVLAGVIGAADCPHHHPGVVVLAVVVSVVLLQSDAVSAWPVVTPPMMLTLHRHWVPTTVPTWRLTLAPGLVSRHRHRPTSLASPQLTSPASLLYLALYGASAGHSTS